MTTPAVFRFIWFIGGFAVLLGLARDWVLHENPLPPSDDATASWVDGGFRANGIYSTTRAGILPRHVDHRGSWIDGDEWEGRAETAWLHAPARIVRVAVAGYPQHPGCSLWAEYRAADGIIRREECPLENPRETWEPWDLHPPASTIALRLIAEDRAADPEGWLAFSHPFLERPPGLTVLYMLAQGITTVALAFTLVWGPGILWATRGTSAAIRMAFWLGAGPVILGVGGVLIWALGGMMPPSMLAVGIVAALWIAIGARLWQRGRDLLDGPPVQALAVSALIVLAVAAKAAYSGGPDGELYGGTIARTLAVGDRSDAGIPFCVVQVAAHHLPPASPEAERHFSPWTFYSRGPLAGLAAVPIVLATGGEPPTRWPEDRWQSFDGAGYAAYRITLMVLASTVIVALFAALALLVGEPWALIGAGLLALSPFGVHEVMFTWPKWAAVAGVLASFMLAHARHAFAAGIALAIGFFYHPMALLSAPWIGLWTLGRAEKNLPARAGALFRVAGGAGMLVLPWMVIAATAPHLPQSEHAGHGHFLRYWVLADYGRATWETWWSTRWRNFADTFFPLRLYAIDRGHHTLSSVYAPSGPLVRFAFSWWNSLPFGLGLGLWVLGIIAIARAGRNLSAAIGVLVVGPALMITAYWGAISVGLMRECGHALFVAVIGVTCVACVRAGGGLRTAVLHPIVPWLQLPETLLMLWLTTLAAPRPGRVDFAALDWVYATANVAALALAAAVLSRARTARLVPLSGPCDIDAAAAPQPATSSRSRRAIWAGAGLLVLLAAARDAKVARLVTARPLAPVTPIETGSWFTGGFRKDGVFTTTTAGNVPSGLPTAGSWLDGDNWQGRAETVWFNLRGQPLLVGVAGYPQNEGCKLWAEFRGGDHALIRVDCDLPNAREKWTEWKIHRPVGATAIRLVAEDHSVTNAGWLAFSRPYTRTNRLVLLGITLCGVIALGVGWVLAARRLTARKRPRISAPHDGHPGNSRPHPCDVSSDG